MNIVEKIIYRILNDAAVADFVMEMGTAHEPCPAAFRNEVAALNPLTFTYQRFREVSIKSFVAVAMIDHHHRPISPAALSGKLYGAVARGKDGGTDIINDIEALMVLPNSQDRMQAHAEAVCGVKSVHRLIPGKLLYVTAPAKYPLL